MTGTVFIGLAVTSHAAGVVTQAEFSNVTTTGNVTGQWQSASLGIDQPAGNLPDALYIAVEDSSGHKATVVNTDPYAVGRWCLDAMEHSAEHAQLGRRQDQQHQEDGDRCG